MSELLHATPPDQQRTELEALLARWDSPIPPGRWADFLRFQYQHNRRFVALAAWVACLGYLVYAVADMLLVPDITTLTLWTRGLATAVMAPLLGWLFARVRDVRVWDSVLLTLVMVCTLLWFWMLAQSEAGAPRGYIHAALVFLVIQALVAQTRFWLAAAALLVTAVATTVAATVIAPGPAPRALTEFICVALPVLLFCLLWCWNQLLAARRAFLRQSLDDLNRAELLGANERLMAEVEKDLLTGTGNRRAFHAQLEQLWQRTPAEGQAFGLLIADVDHFKRFSDGHRAGDECLVRVAGAMLDVARQNNATISRLGGEEFALLVPRMDMQRLQAVGQQLVEAVRALAIAHQHRPDAIDLVTVSVGGCVSSDVRHADSSNLLRQADVMLYAAKRLGRDRAITYTRHHRDDA